jgi:hypothetical protein
MAALPPIGFALYLHGLISGAHNAWRRGLQWSHAKCTWSGGWHDWGVQNKTLQKLRGNGDLALSGRNLNGIHNNQPKVDVRGRRDIGEVARGG